MDEMKITREVYDAIVENLSTRTTECGGVLGAGADGIVSEFYFDATGQSNPNGYAPDVNAINKMLINDWMPHSILMVGIVHSHVNGVDVPSCGDINYGIRILQALDTVDRFYLPIVVFREGRAEMTCYAILSDPVHNFICKKIPYEIIDKIGS